MPDGSQGSWVKGFDGQTGRLEQSNDEKRTNLWIIGQCEDEREAARQQVRPRTFVERLTPWREGG